MVVPKRVFRWKEIDALVEKLARKIPPKRFAFLFGIPKNGLIVAHLLSAKTNIPVLCVSSARVKKRRDRESILVVDDLVDSGKTLAAFKGFSTAVLIDKHQRVRVSFAARNGPRGWIEFPWEENEASDADTALVRLLERLHIDAGETSRQARKQWLDALAKAARPTRRRDR